MTNLPLLGLVLGAMGFFLGAFVFFAIAFWRQRRLITYLKTSKHDRWEQLTTNLSILGPGMRNSKKVFAYVFNNVDCEDEFIRTNKYKLRWAIMRGLLCIGAGVVTGVMFYFRGMLS